MSIQDHQITASIYANPPGGGETQGAYCDRILHDLIAQYPAEADYIRERTGDILRRINVIVARRHPGLAGAGASYGAAAREAGNEHFRRVRQAEQTRFAAHNRRNVHGPDLNESFAIGEQRDERRAIAAVMGIRDAGHAHHHGNFDADQTRRQLIDNLFAQVRGADFRVQVAQRVLEHYGYDPR